MARRAGYNALIKMDLTTTATGSLTTFSFANSWLIDETRADNDMTAFGDTSLIHVVGLPDQKITISGHADVGNFVQARLRDGLARGCSIYPDNTNNATTLFSGGTFYWSGSITGTTGGGVDFTLTGVPASSGTWSTNI